MEPSQEDTSGIAFACAVLDALPYVPNVQQQAVLEALARFVSPEANPHSVFILNGYAGTGKTSLTGAVVSALAALGRKTVLMAPTGRAAKVFSGNAHGNKAHTIHRKIYRHVPAEGSFSQTPMPAENKSRDTLFIVDEASMIGGDDAGSLLDDLVQYVYSGEGCRLLLLGDTAQLPPVGSTVSPAMEADTFRRMGLKVTRATLTQIARQSSGSGILVNATSLRKAMLASPDENGNLPLPRLRFKGLTDVSAVDSEDLPDVLSRVYADDPNEAIIITRSNKRAVEYNMAIRNQVLYREELISAGDLLIVSKNHYFNTKRSDGLEFIANGEAAKVLKVFGTERRYGLHFADVRLLVGESAEIDIKIILTTLTSPAAHLENEARQRMYTAIALEKELTTDPYRLASHLRSDPYWNALEVKYAYAVTCHKAQGGQWRNVFVDTGYIPEDAYGPELYRWLYTAVTRATDQLFIIAPPDRLL